MSKKFAVCCLFMSLQACVSPPKEIYHWGDYDKVLAKSLTSHGQQNTAQHIQQLLDTIDQTSATGKAIPPGLFAHLGYLYSVQQRNEKAVAAFKKEYELFPNAKPLMERLISNITKPSPLDA